MRWLLFISLLLFCSKAYASNIEITYSTITDSKNVIKTKFLLSGYNFNSNKYRIRAVSENLLVSIWHKKNSNWVTSEDSWSNQPYLEEQMEIKISPNNFVLEKIALFLQDVITGEIIEFKDLTVWNDTWYKNYLEVLNKSILAV